MRNWLNEVIKKRKPVPLAIISIVVLTLVVAFGIIFVKYSNIPLLDTNKTGKSKTVATLNSPQTHMLSSVVLSSHNEKSTPANPPLTNTSSAPTSFPSATPVNTAPVSDAICQTLDKQVANELNASYSATGESVNNYVTNLESQYDLGIKPLSGIISLTASQISNILSGANNLIQNDNQNAYKQIYQPYVSTQTERGCPISVQMENYPSLKSLP